MFVYVSGPYSAPSPAGVEANVRRADDVAVALAARGHVPFVPHTMMRGWEDERGVPRDVALAVCLAWVARCDALYRIAPSPGADAELAAAREHGLPVFHELAEVPDPSEVLG